MDNASPVLRLLAQSRIKLNLLLMAAKFLAWIVWAGAVSGGIFLVINLVGWFQIGITIWILITLSCGLPGLIIGWRRRLDNRAAARWLDEHLNSGEILSAALVCLERGCSGSFDEQILNAANTFAQDHTQIKWPFRFLLKQASLVAGIIILFTAGLIFLTPVFYSNNDRVFLGATGVKKMTGKHSRRNSQRLVVKSPRTLAKMLFPDDVKMAMLAERALREGDFEVLQDLLRDAELNMERQLPEMVESEEQRRVKNEVERRQELMESLIAESEKENQTGSKSREGKGSDSSRLALTETNARRKGNRLGKGRSLKNNQSLQDDTEDEDFDPSDYPPGGGSEAGTGHNPNKGNWGKVAARTGKEETIISRNKESQILEYVLPGKKPRLPLTQVIPDSRRSAEAAIYREGIPFEYEEFIRNYFLTLSQETKGTTLKEAQK